MFPQHVFESFSIPFKDQVKTGHNCLSLQSHDETDTGCHVKMSHLLRTQKNQEKINCWLLAVRQEALKKLISKPNFSLSHFSVIFSACQRYGSSAHYPVCSSSLPLGGSLTSAAAPACPAGMAPGWAFVEHLRVSADRLSAREHCVSGTLAQINKQSRTFVFCMAYKGHISTSIP